MPPSGLLIIVFIVVGGIAACGVTGHVGGRVEVDPPGGTFGRTELEFNVASDGTTTWSAESETPPACVEINWIGSDGSVIATETGTIPGSGQVPAGAVRYEASEGDCPEDEEPQSGGSGNSGNSGGNSNERLPITNPIQGHVTAGYWITGGPKYSWYHVHGGPIIPDDDPTARNGTYSLMVYAKSPRHANRRASSVIANGIGSTLPPLVKINAFTESTMLGTGILLRAGNPKAFEGFTLGLNDDPVYADLLMGQNVAEYQEAGWNVVEVFIPFDDLDMGSAPGVTYTNMLSASMQNLGMSEPATAEYVFDYSL